MRPLLMAFDAPYAITFDEAGAHGMPHRGTLEGLARQRGIRALSSEIGGTGGVTAASLSVARQGLVNVLHHVGSVPSPVAADWRLSRSVELSLTRDDQHLTAPAAGWFTPSVSLGDAVIAGDIIGHILRDDNPLGAADAVIASSDGVVVSLWHPVRCGKGEVVAFIADPMPKTSPDF
jgi:predicted deacylase